MKLCWRCDGSGEGDRDGTKCMNCNGTGEDHSRPIPDDDWDDVEWEPKED